MKIFLDTAEIDLISSASGTGLIDGVTTNPTLIRKSGRDPVEVIKEISQTFPTLQSISAEVVAETAEEMIDQAQAFNGLWNVTIKVPCTVEGLKACTALAVNNYKVNVTLVFSVAQAILAEKAGATYISPFIGRWEDNSVDGLELIKNIREVYNGHGRFTTTQILGASVRDVRQVEKCALFGADVVTIPPLVFWSMYKNIMTEKGLEQFQRDWEEIRGVSK
jgi:transaldolase